MTNDSIKLAKLWTNLKIVKDALGNEVIPVLGYFGIEDPKFVIALEDVSAQIENHFERFRLVAETEIHQ